jgi:hypothetical protein
LCGEIAEKDKEIEGLRLELERVGVSRELLMTQYYKCCDEIISTRSALEREEILCRNVSEEAKNLRVRLAHYDEIHRHEVDALKGELASFSSRKNFLYSEKATPLSFNALDEEALSRDLSMMGLLVDKTLPPTLVNPIPTFISAAGDNKDTRIQEEHAVSTYPKIPQQANTQNTQLHGDSLATNERDSQVNSPQSDNPYIQNSDMKPVSSTLSDTQTTQPPVGTRGRRGVTSDDSEW